MFSPHFVGDACLRQLYTSLAFAMSQYRVVRPREAKMASKQVTLAVSAVLFTAINLLALSANWSITAHARVAGMDFSALAVDADFRRAIRDVVSQMDQSYWRRNNGFRGAVVEVVERCHLPYRESTSLRCRVQSF